MQGRLTRLPARAKQGMRHSSRGKIYGRNAFPATFVATGVKMNPMIGTRYHMVASFIFQ